MRSKGGWSHAKGFAPSGLAAKTRAVAVKPGLPVRQPLSPGQSISKAAAPGVTGSQPRLSNRPPGPCFRRPSPGFLFLATHVHVLK